MNKNEFVEMIETILDGALIPDTKEEADKVLREAGVDVDEWNRVMYKMIREELKKGEICQSRYNQ